MKLFSAQTYLRQATRGVAQDRPKQGPQSAFCAVVRRLGETMHKILRLQAHAEGSLRVGVAKPPCQKI